MLIPDLRDFLAASDWAGATAHPLAYDMSDRRYWRLEGGPKPALLMLSQAAHEPIAPYIQIAAHLRALGLRAPDIYGHDLDNGFAIVEDFGKGTYTAQLAAGASEMALYMLATDVLIALHRHADTAVVDRPAYSMSALITELRVCLDWFHDQLPDAGPWQPFEQHMTDLMAAVAEDRSVFVMRDYHVDNLMIVPGATGLQSCGLLDFQDGLIGAPAYDLVSLLQDARRDVSPDVQTACLDHYLGAFPDLDALTFRQHCAILGLQRHIKVIGVFVRYYRRYDRPTYLHHLPRLARLIAHCAARTGHPDTPAIVRALYPSLDAACAHFAQKAAPKP